MVCNPLYRHHTLTSHYTPPPLIVTALISLHLTTKWVTVSFPFSFHLFSWAHTAVHTQVVVSSFNAPVIQISLLSLHFANYIQFLLINKHLQFLSLSETWRMKEQSVPTATGNQTICLGMWIASMDKTNLPVAFWKLLLGKPLPLPCCTRQCDWGVLLNIVRHLGSNK